MTRKPKETKTPAPTAGAHAPGTFGALPHRATFTAVFAGDKTNKAGRYLKVASTHATNLTTHKLCRFNADDLVSQ